MNELARIEEVMHSFAREVRRCNREMRRLNKLLAPRRKRWWRRG